MTDATPRDQLQLVHSRIDAHDTQIRAVDARISVLETQQAVAAERSKHIERSLSNIEGGVGWLIKLVVGGIIAGIVAFLIQGGFNVG